MNIFIDESIHDSEGFIVTSFIEAPDDTPDFVASALTRAGLRPGIDEFKSRMPMNGRPEIHSLRSDLFGIILRNARLALLITSTHRRKMLGEEVLSTLELLVAKHDLPSAELAIYVDQGIRPPKTAPSAALTHSKIKFGQDSRTVVGLQLADLGARYGALLLLERVRGAKKFVYVGKESGFDPGFDAELGWFIRARLRRNFFMEEKDWSDHRNHEAGDWFWHRQLVGYGVFLGVDVPEHIVSAVRDVYDITWLGCIH